MIKIVAYEFFGSLHVSIEAVYSNIGTGVSQTVTEPLVVGVFEHLVADDPALLVEAVLDTLSLSACERTLCERGGLRAVLA